MLGGPETMRVVLNSSSTPPSIAIAAPVLGGPEVVRVVLNSSSSSCAWGSGVCARVVLNSSSSPAARCVEQQLNSSSSGHWFTLEGEAAPPPLEPPPTNGLCNTNSRLCVGHTSVHSDSGSRAWGSGGCARCVEQQQQQRRNAPVHSDSDPRAWGSGDHARCVEQQQQQGVRSVCARALC